MHALIAGAAPEPGGEGYYGRLLATAPFVIAADAAAEWCVALGRTPELVVADFDSSAPGAAERLSDAGSEVLGFPSAKDASDLDLALAEARARSVTTVTFTAMTSLRLDHTLAALGTVLDAADLEARVLEPSLAGWALDGASRPGLELRGDRGSVVSIFAVGGVSAGISLEGFRFPLTEASLGPMTSHGLSNELIGAEARITLRAGRILVLSPGAPGLRASDRGGEPAHWTSGV